MKRERLDARRLMALSRSFRYPDRWPGEGDLALLFARGVHSPGVVVEKDLAALQATYVHLFINALPEVPCPPYGSFYLEGVLMGESTVRLKRLYGEYGFEVDELADHIAVELEFLGLLATLTDEPAVGEDYGFLLEHLRKWTPEFLDRVEQTDSLGFYRCVAAVVRSTIFHSRASMTT
ncbi:MAG: molecular chaperone TorD family protein [Deltaproteobacteria bacterium]|nr:molecular chaperone TorD family protein [Deltaproteobacteria bacterium]